MSARPTVLAVDDTPANLVALEAVLDHDFELRFARSGREAIALLEKQPDVDVILMDLQMPGMDGFEAATRIKAMPACAEIPIVFITAVYHEDPHVKRGYEVGGVDYFTKPFDPDLLRLKVGIYAAFRQRVAFFQERERQIRETEEILRTGRRLSGFLESLPVGVLIADIEGRICQANEEVSRICNSTTLIDNDRYGAMLGWWDAEGRLLKTHGGPLARALDGKVVHKERLEIRCVDGAMKSVFTSSSPLFGVDRAIVGAVVVVQDVSVSKQIESELETRLARLVSTGVEIERTIA